MLVVIGHVDALQVHAVESQDEFLVLDGVALFLGLTFTVALEDIECKLIVGHGVALFLQQQDVDALDGSLVDVNLSVQERSHIHGHRERVEVQHLALLAVGDVESVELDVLPEKTDADAVNMNTRLQLVGEQTCRPAQHAVLKGAAIEHEEATDNQGNHQHYHS